GGIRNPDRHLRLKDAIEFDPIPGRRIAREMAENRPRRRRLAASAEDEPVIVVERISHETENRGAALSRHRERGEAGQPPLLPDHETVDPAVAADMPPPRQHPLR